VLRRAVFSLQYQQRQPVLLLDRLANRQGNANRISQSVSSNRPIAEREFDDKIDRATPLSRVEPHGRSRGLNPLLNLSAGESTTNEHQAGRLYLTARVMDMEDESLLTWRLNPS
jgi:hypothetical protein